MVEGGVAGPRPAPASVRLAVPPRHRFPDLAAFAVGLGFGAAVALPLTEATPATLAAPGGVATLAGDVAAMAGSYLLLVMVLLTARLPLLEAAIGQDRLLGWHRRLAPAPLLLIGAHGVLTVLGFAQAAGLGFVAEAGSLITTMAFIFAAVVSYAMLVAIAAVSLRAVRRRVSYETWWLIHLYTYLALAFSVPHQVVDGTTLAGHPVWQTAWLVLWAATAGVVVAYRVGLPVLRSIRHRMEIDQVHEEAPGIFSLLIRGRRLDRLPVAGGQYFDWHFLAPGLWWQAHPFSLSALPHEGRLRVTFKVTGDATRAISGLPRGTRIVIEGPYGAFTEGVRHREKVALIGAGVGITPLRSLLEDLPKEVDTLVVERASTAEEIVHRDELRALATRCRGRFVELVGPRSLHPLDDPAYLRAVVPDLLERDVYVCGPGEFSEGVVAAARSTGVEADAIHRERFDY